MSNRRNIQFLYNPHNKATLLDCNFVVDSANTNGLGVSSLNASGRIASVYMHTSATPATGNPNPASGLIVVRLQDNYNAYLGGFNQRIVPLSGSNISSGLTVGAAYVITVLGTTSAAQWIVAGVPANVTPALGVSFIAAATSFTGTGKVKVPAAAGSGISKIEMIGTPVLSNSNGAYLLGASNGMQLIFGCYSISSTVTMASYTPAGTNDSATPPIFTGTAATLTGTVASASALAAPADGSLISLAFYLNDSAQGV